ncbi:MAG: hypothetical protein AAFX44_04695 [Pseudomonadota bacterium]
MTRRGAFCARAGYLALVVLASAANADTVVLSSQPAGAAVFTKDRGAVFFEGFTPYKVDSNTGSDQRFVLLKPGYENADVRISPDNADTVVLSPHAEPDRLQSDCLTVDRPLDRLQTRLEVLPPVHDAVYDDAPTLVVTARIVGRKLHSDLRAIRRTDGKKAYYDMIRSVAAPLAEQLYQSKALRNCYPQILVRTIYTSRSVDLAWLRETTLKSRSYTSTAGNTETTTTIYGKTTVTSGTLVIDPSNKKYLDVVFLAPAASPDR